MGRKMKFGCLVKKGVAEVRERDLPEVGPYDVLLHMKVCNICTTDYGQWLGLREHQGYPMAGGVGGSEEIMSCIAAGVKAGKKKAYVGGTLTANPLSCAAGYFAINEIIKQDAAKKAGENGDKLCDGIQKLIDKYELPFVTWNTGSIVHFEVSGVMYLSVTDPDIFKKIPERQQYIEEFGAALTANGVITLAGSRIYTSMADNAQTLAAFEEVFSNIEK